jgi:hypothetical protein
MSPAFLKALPHIEQCEEIFIFARKKIIYFLLFLFLTSFFPSVILTNVIVHTKIYLIFSIYRFLSKPTCWSRYPKTFIIIQIIKIQWIKSTNFESFT